MKPRNLKLIIGKDDRVEKALDETLAYLQKHNYQGDEALNFSINLLARVFVIAFDSKKDMADFIKDHFKKEFPNVLKWHAQWRWGDNNNDRN